MIKLFFFINENAQIQQMLLRLVFFLLSNLKRAGVSQIDPTHNRRLPRFVCLVSLSYFYKLQPSHIHFPFRVSGSDHSEK